MIQKCELVILFLCMLTIVEPYVCLTLFFIFFSESILLFDLYFLKWFNCHYTIDGYYRKVEIIRETITLFPNTCTEIPTYNHQLLFLFFGLLIFNCSYTVCILVPLYVMYVFFFFWLLLRFFSYLWFSVVWLWCG